MLAEFVKKNVVLAEFDGQKKYIEKSTDFREKNLEKKVKIVEKKQLHFRC